MVTTLSGICYYRAVKVFSQFAPEVIELLRRGAIGVIPTDTVYGVVGKLLDEAAVNRIYTVKGHPPSRAVGTVVVSSTSQLKGLVDDELLVQAAKHWPGATSVILPVDDRLHYAHRGLNSLPFRHPDNEALVALVAKTGPLATSSANLSSQHVAPTIQAAIDYFGDTVDFYVDGGDLSGRSSSQIIRYTNGEQEVLRGD